MTRLVLRFSPQFSMILLSFIRLFRNNCTHILMVSILEVAEASVTHSCFANIGASFNKSTSRK